MIHRNLVLMFLPTRACVRACLRGVCVCVCRNRLSGWLTCAKLISGGVTVQQTAATTLDLVETHTWVPPDTDHKNLMVLVWCRKEFPMSFRKKQAVIFLSTIQWKHLFFSLSASAAFYKLGLCTFFFCFIKQNTALYKCHYCVIFICIT